MGLFLRFIKQELNKWFGFLGGLGEVLEPPMVDLEVVLGRSWRLLEPPMVDLEVVLGSSWRLLEPPMVDLEVVLGEVLEALGTSHGRPRGRLGGGLGVSWSLP